MSLSALQESNFHPPLKVAVQRLPHAESLPLPSYGTAASAGLDLYAAIDKDVVIAPGDWQAIPTGISIALPLGFEAQVRSRSGLAAKHGVVVLNAPGTIDADYRGEILVLLVNHGKEPFTLTRGMRCAQMVIAPVTTIAWDEQAILEKTGRGSGGFGSTGMQ
jgi:dUTP pyrophosphatase